MVVASVAPPSGGPGAPGGGAWRGGGGGGTRDGTTALGHHVQHLPTTLDKAQFRPNTHSQGQVPATLEDVTHKFSALGV